MRIYNTSIHNSIDRAPDSVTRKNARELFDYLELKRSHFKKRKRYAKFRINDLIRIPIKYLPKVLNSGEKQNIFTKGSKPKWSKELFKITEIHYGTFVPMYSIQNAYKFKVHRRFYENELNLVKSVSEN